MLKRISIDLTAVESMLFFWQLIAEREKVSELYILRLTELPPFQNTYSENFNHISLRRVLSAISNKEHFIGENRAQGRFWSNNLWMLEDLPYIHRLIQPLKQLNVDGLIPRINESLNKTAYEHIEIYFVPLHLDEYYLIKNKIYINFFSIIPLADEKPAINIDQLKEKIFNWCLEIENK